jgi:hypothetical protein
MTSPWRSYAERAHGLEHKLRDIRGQLDEAQSAAAALIGVAGQRGEPEMAATLTAIWSRIAKARRTLREAPPVPEMPGEEEL